MNTPIDVLLTVADIGGQLGITGENLLLRLPADCQPELKNAIRHHKSALLELLSLNFVVIHSDALNATVIWAPDEATKASLADAGADCGRIYTASELERLVHGRIPDNELNLIHAAKQRFSGRIL